MKYPLDTLRNPRVVLDYSGYLLSHPESMEELGDVLVIPYTPGASHPSYMCDTVAIETQQGDDLNDLFDRAKRAAPFAYQAIFYGKEASMFGSRETCAVCVDRNQRFRQKHLC